VLPLSFPHPETGVPVPLYVSLPNPYTLHAAARHAGYTWREFATLPPRERTWAHAQYVVNRLVEVHTADATATRQEDEQRMQQAMMEAKRHG
jgi:hypothetical protein